MTPHSCHQSFAFATPLRLCVPSLAYQSSPMRTCCRPMRRPLTHRRPRMHTPLSPDDQPEPTSDPPNSFNMEVLRRRMTDLHERVNNGYEPRDQIFDLSLTEHDDDDDEEEAERLAEEFDSLGTIWVILFTNTSDGTEGVYSLSIAEENIVLAFEDKEEAQRYSFCLEAQKFPVPQICELETAELREFCSESGFRLGFVPRGSLISPPEESAIDDLDKWRGSPSSSSTGGATGMTEEDIESMKKRLDSLFGE